MKRIFYILSIVLFGCLLLETGCERPELLSYVVSFNANGGEGVMGNQIFQEETSQALSTNGFSRDGFVFDGWNTKADGTGTDYSDRQNIIVSTDMTLYAQWTQNVQTTYTVSFNNNGGSGSMSPQNFQQGVEQALSANAFTRFGHTFSGWNTKANGTGTSYADRQNITVSTDMTLYAQWTQSFSAQTFTVGGVSFTMKPVSGGTFWMGAQNNNSNGQNYDNEAGNDESPVHQVTLSNYYIGETEVTQALWEAVMGNWPGTVPSSTYGVGYNYPAYNVSWNDIQTFIAQLNALTGLTFRLPTEAEWEFAARGGNYSNGYLYSGGNSIGSVSWYYNNCSSQTHPVKGKTPNELDLYDMSGNVCEWCYDWYGSYGNSSQSNPSGATSGSDRVFRGGCWSEDASHCRVANRNAAAPHANYNYVGFRLVAVPSSGNIVSGDYK